MVRVRALLSKLIGAGLVGFALLRVDLCTGFGRGTGFGKIHVSSLSVTAHFGLNQLHHLPPQAQHVAKRLLVALTIPGEVAVDYGILPPPKKKKSTKKRDPVTLEARANAWLDKQKNSRAMREFLNENSFAVAGGLISLLSMLLAAFFPYEAFQNALVGLGCFWFGANGAHGSAAQFSYEFMATVVILVLALVFLAEPDELTGKAKEAKEAALKKKNKKAGKTNAKKKKDDDGEDDWDDGIGGVTMDEVRAKGGFGDKCCG